MFINYLKIFTQFPGYEQLQMSIFDTETIVSKVLNKFKNMK